MREITGIETDFPWTVFVWKRYAAPFDSEKIRDVRRYDDIDYVQGDDFIEGGAGNDIIHGQRGDDTLYGDEGNDELYGELGDDALYGGDGDDILLGDIGYAVRRYSKDEPILISAKNSSDNLTLAAISNGPVWKKDIVLEELGNITNVAVISDKLNPQNSSMTAESISAASLVFVAAAYKDGVKFEEEKWVTEMFTFSLENSYDDHLDGGDGDDVLIGQRGMFMFV